MKSPPLQYTDDEARQLTEAFMNNTAIPKINRVKLPSRTNQKLRCVSHPKSQPQFDPAKNQP